MLSLTMVNMLIMLCFVLGLFGVFVVFLKKVRERSVVQQTFSSRPYVSHHLALDLKRRLICVVYGDSEYVILLGPQQDLLLQSRFLTASSEQPQKQPSKEILS